MTTSMDRLRTESGNVVESDKLIAFMYLLMRDYVTPGEVQDIINELESGKGPIAFTNGYLAKYAKFVAGELHG